MIPIIKNRFSKEKSLKIYPKSQLSTVTGKTLDLYKPLPTNFTDNEALIVGRLIKQIRIHELINQIEDLIDKGERNTDKTQSLFFTLHKHCMILYRKYGGPTISLFYSLTSNIQNTKLSKKVNGVKFNRYLFSEEFPVNILDIPDIIDHHLPILYTFNDNKEILFIEFQFISYKKNNKVNIYSPGKNKEIFELRRNSELSEINKQIKKKGIYGRISEEGDISLISNLDIGKCMICKRELTDGKSIALGIGYKCLNKLSDYSIEKLNNEFYKKIFKINPNANNRDSV